MQKYNSCLIPCNSHKNKIVGFICTKEACKNRFLCGHCTKDHDSSHFSHYVSVVELFSTDFDTECEEASNMTEKIAKEIEDIRSEIDQALDSLKNDLIEAVESIRDDLKNKIELFDSNQIYSILQQAKNKVIEFTDLNPDEMISSKDELVDNFSKFRQLKMDIMNRKLPDSYTYTKMNDGELKKLLKKILKKRSSTTNWSWSNEHKSISLIHDKENETVTLPKGNTGNHGIIGDQIFSNGRHEWQLTFDPNISPGSWGVGFGILSKEKIKLVTSWSSFPYQSAICRASDGHVYNLESHEELNHRGKLTKCVLDYDTEKFEVWTDGKMVASTKISKDTEYVPFLDYNTSAYVKLSFE